MDYGHNPQIISKNQNNPHLTSNLQGDNIRKSSKFHNPRIITTKNLQIIIYPKNLSNLIEFYVKRKITYIEM